MAYQEAITNMKGMQAQGVVVSISMIDTSRTINNEGISDYYLYNGDVTVSRSLPLRIVPMPI